MPESVLDAAAELADVFREVDKAAFATLGMHLFEVQKRAGAALHQGRVVEMQTGEGKTLAAVAPACLNALTGKGVHVLTFNDYLAKRDARWMGPIYEAMGLSVGYIQQGMSVAERRRAYACDVTYATAKEAGFDLLRDQLCLERDDQVHRPFQFAIIDEADSILIDEARIPLVIAGELERPGVSLVRLAALARGLEPGYHYNTDAYRRNIFLTERGTQRVESSLRCGNLYAPEQASFLAEIRNALHAEVLLRRDIDYVVRDGAVELVDELTGRIAENRHWPDGLNVAVEAKEGLRIRGEGQILGSITLQRFVRLYPRLSGMTGTACAAAEELKELYGLDVEVIPTNRPCKRVDHPDVIHTSKKAKYDAVLEEIHRVHATGQPILVGTVSVAESELVARDLRKSGIDGQVLNAKNDEEEAAIIAKAGRVGAVTISTNMAGRGTDIRLEQREPGLYVIGTNRHESRRTDDQLRGRAGRQGDPGASRFFISLEHDLIRQYGIRELIPKRLLPDGHDGVLDSAVVRHEIERAQRIIEGEHFDIRKRLFDYSSVIETQRQHLAAWRQDVLEAKASLALLATRSSERWRMLCDAVDTTGAGDLERRLTLLAIDRVWSEVLREVQSVRDEVPILALSGQTPLVKFCRIAQGSFASLPTHIDDDIVRTFDALTLTDEGVDWKSERLRSPSATWTYLVTDEAYGTNALLGLANKPAIGALGVVALGPILFLWALHPDGVDVVVADEVEKAFLLRRLVQIEIAGHPLRDLRPLHDAPRARHGSYGRASACAARPRARSSRPRERRRDRIARPRLSCHES